MHPPLLDSYLPRPSCVYSNLSSSSIVPCVVEPPSSTFHLHPPFPSISPSLFPVPQIFFLQPIEMTPLSSLLPVPLTTPIQFSASACLLSLFLFWVLCGLKVYLGAPCIEYTYVHLRFARLSCDSLCVFFIHASLPPPLLTPPLCKLMHMGGAHASEDRRNEIFGI